MADNPANAGRNLPPTVWTLDAALIHLKELLKRSDEFNRAQYEALDKKIDVALNTALTATNKAEDAASKRFEAGNEIKAAMADQAKTFLPKAEAAERFKAIDDRTGEKFKAVEDRIIAMEQLRTTGNQWGISTVLSIVSALIASAAVIVSIVLKH